MASTIPPITISFADSTAGVNFAVSQFATVAQFLNTFTDTPISLPTTATGTYNLTSIGVFPSPSDDTVWRLFNGTTSDVNATLSGTDFSKTLTLPANTNTYVRSTAPATHKLTVGSNFYTKSASTQEINLTNTDIDGKTRIAPLPDNVPYFITGSDFNDTLTGGKTADTIIGGLGNDSLTGGDGNDTIIGGLGNDSLTGGNQADRFIFNNFNEGVDTITDFNSAAGQDIINVSAAGFGGGLTAGLLPALRFRSGAGAVTANNANQRFIYNSSTGDLRFDQDGSAAGFSPILIATLTGAPTLSGANNRITVIA